MICIINLQLGSCCYASTGRFIRSGFVLGLGLGLGFGLIRWFGVPPPTPPVDNNDITKYVTVINIYSGYTWDFLLGPPSPMIVQ